MSASRSKTLRRSKGKVILNSHSDRIVQKIPGRQYRGLAEWVQNEQIGIAGNDATGLGRNSGFEIFVVFGVAANPYLLYRFDNDRCFPKHFQKKSASSRAK